MSGAPVALLGLGHWGRHHFRVLQELQALRGAYDPDPSCLERVSGALRYPGVDALLADPEVRAVVLATPARTHYDLARRCLLAGKDVFVEKPLTLDESEGEDLVRRAAAAGRVLMVGHITLHHGAIAALKRLVEAGELGRLRYLYANRLNLGTVREAEDILWSFAPHDIAVFLHLLGTWPERVAAHGADYLRAGRADVTITHFEFPDGVRGHIFVSWLHPLKEHRLVVIGDRRMAAFEDGPDGGSLQVFDAGAAPGGPLNVAARGRGDAVSFDRTEPLRAELEHFLACMSGRREPLTGGRHGLDVLRILATARRSLLEGGVPIAGAAAAERAG